MGLIRLSAPASEPVTLAEAKAHLRVVDSVEDALIGALIAVAREALEEDLQGSLVTQSFRLALDAWPHPLTRLAFALPRPPLRSVDAVRTFDAAGAATLWPAASYTSDGSAVPGRLVRQPGANWPTPGRAIAGIEIDFTAGYGAPADVPAALRRALLLRLAHLFEHREAAPAEANALLPLGYDALLAPYRRVRL